MNLLGCLQDLNYTLLDKVVRPVLVQPLTLVVHSEFVGGEASFLALDVEGVCPVLD